MLTVIIPCFNPGPVFLDTLGSLAEQTARLFNVIIVNDCSTNEFFDNAVLPNNVIVLSTPENSGPGVARNIGVRHTDTKYLMFLDSDDLLHKDCVSRLLAAIIRIDADAVACGYKKFKDNCKSQALDEGRVTSKIDRLTFVAKRGFAPWGVIFKTEFISRFPFSSELRNAEDIYFTVSYLHAMKQLHYLDEKLFFYRVDVENSLTANKADHAAATGQAIEALNKKFNTVFIQQINLLLFTQFYWSELVFSKAHHQPIQMISPSKIRSWLVLNLLSIFLYIKTGMNLFLKLNTVFHWIYRAIKK